MVIGITGSFGSGKTTVARMFRQLGAYVIDADKICRSLMKPSKQPYRRIVRHFGKDILKKDKTIHRRRLAGVVFNNRSRLRLLNKLIHPAAIKEIDKIIYKRKRRVVVVDAALLIESGFYKNMDRLIVIRTDRNKQLKRIVGAKGMTRNEALKRIRMQAPLNAKLALADFVIDNSGTKKETKAQVDKIWGKIRGGLCQ